MLSYNYDVASRNVSTDIQPRGSVRYKSSVTDLVPTVYVWGDKAQSLQEILTDATLPLVVKLCNDNIINDKETPVDLCQPLLLYKEVKGKKLHARNLKSGPAVRDVGRTVYHPQGPPVTFPETFPGYFKLIDSRDQPLSSIADVGRLMSKSFVSSSTCQGYVCLSQLKDTLYQKTNLLPGLYRPSNIFEGSITYINKRKTEKKKLVRCLSCEDERGKKVMFPMDSKGGFYISELNPTFSRHMNIDPACRVYKWTEFDPKKLKGLRVRLLYGRVPKEECQFTGFLELSQATPEHTVIGCTMTSSPRLFEMAMTSEPFFVVALNSEDFASGTLQQKCTQFAKRECDAYMQEIKVKKEYDIDQTSDQG